MTLNEYQEKWLQLLESDEYADKQNFSALSDGDGCYCALGLAFLVFPGKYRLDFTQFTNIYNLREKYSTHVSPYIEQTLKLRSSSGYIGHTKYLSVISLNDGFRFSFKEIAKFIRDNPEKVFTN